MAEFKSGRRGAQVRPRLPLAEKSILGVDSPFFSAIVLFENQPFPQGFWWFSRKKDPWKDGNGSDP